ncbi:unnamed protein product [Staurois parvus]|uniref:Uncharacterized protein n=1 Tax=Staurois parvus TaxID=386267 RepID=A0ABN9F1Q2_9NEOB|nr:unnamed protein product [Staurois parvus]
MHAPSEFDDEDDDEYEYMNRKRQPSERLEYEYMDIRGAGDTSSECRTSTGGDNKDDDYDYGNKEEYEYMNEQRRSNSQDLISEGAEEYTYMNRNSRMRLDSTSDAKQGYEDMNLIASRPKSLDKPKLIPQTCHREALQKGYIQPLRELEVKDCAFDNPDYWHSRLFVKSDSQRT